ncbi:MAG: hypothetical protein SGI83_18870 [Bacteroidota bacterium]|nr:hypothetical protein [Bacteroidota bacterium]
MEELQHEHNGLIVRIAQPKHIPSILALQKFFHQYEKREDDDLFLFNINNDPFSSSDFEHIIIRGECVIVENGEELIGYMLIDTCSETQGLKDHLKCISVLTEDEYLENETRLAPRFAELFNPEFKDDGLSRATLVMLIYINREKYNAIFSGIFTNSTLLMERLNLGWKIVFDNGMYFFLIWDFTQLDNPQ